MKIIETALQSEQKWREFDSAPLVATDQLTEPQNQPVQQVYLDSRYHFQTWEGFGGAFTESAAHVFHAMPDEVQEQLLKAYFDPQQGLAYNRGRTHINSCDFSLHNWACCEIEDPELNAFTLKREEQEIIPLILRAQQVAKKPLPLLASPWSPPAWMKTNGQMNHGGKLKEKYRQSWAEYYGKFIKAMRQQGVTIDAISVQNEPAATQIWDSCLYTAEEERDFVRDYLGPTLAKQQLDDVRIIFWDHNRAEAFYRAQVMLDDPIASQFVYGLGVHWYEGDNYDNLSLVNQLYPKTPIWFTEGCQEGGPHIGSWDVAERYGHSMIHDLNHGVSSWCDWNLFLDQFGGPNHVGNLCSAPILCDLEKQQAIFNPSYYYIGHFSKFIALGAKRVAVATSSDEIEATAFENLDGGLILVVMNRSDEVMTYRLQHSGKAQYINLPAHAIQTVLVQTTNKGNEYE